MLRHLHIFYNPGEFDFMESFELTKVSVAVLKKH